MNWHFAFFLFLAAALQLHLASAAQDGPEQATGHLLECTRTIVQDKLGDDDGLRLAANLLDSAISETSLPKLQDMVASCRSYAKSAPHGMSPNDEYRSTIGQLKSSANTRRMLENFVSPTTICKRYGAALGTGILFGAGVRIDGNYCISSDGREWLEISPGGGFGLVTVGNIDVGCATDVRENKHPSFSLTDDGYVVQVGFGISVRGNKDHPQDSISRVSGVGVGLFGGMLHEESVNLRVAPLPTITKNLFQLFKFGKVEQFDSMTTAGPCITEGNRAKYENSWATSGSSSTEVYANTAR